MGLLPNPKEINLYELPRGEDIGAAGRVGLIP